MADNNYQNDLFGDDLEGRRISRPSILNRYYKQRVLPQVRVPVEYTVIVAIGVLVLIVIAYAVGVERGKRISAGAAGRASVEEIIAAEKKLESPVIFAGDEEPVLFGGDAIEALDEEDIMNEGGEGGPESSGEDEDVSVYVIQLASFKNEDSARREVEKLNARGVKARVARKGEWYQVFATGYDTIDEAARAKRDLSEKYVDCYIRRVK